MRLLAALFLAAHGLVHGIMWALSFSEEARADLPMDPSHSWLVGGVRSAALAFAVVVTLAFIVASAAVLAGARWWPWAAIVASALSALLLAVFFSSWWTIGFAIDAAVVVFAGRTLANRPAWAGSHDELRRLQAISETIPVHGSLTANPESSVDLGVVPRAGRAGDLGRAAVGSRSSVAKKGGR